MTILETLYYLLLPLVLHIIWSRLYITHCIRACIKNFDYLTVLNSLFYINSWLTCWLALKNVGGKDTPKKIAFHFHTFQKLSEFPSKNPSKIYQIESIINKQFFRSTKPILLPIYTFSGDKRLFYLSRFCQQVELHSVLPTLFAIFWPQKCPTLPWNRNSW